MKPLMIALTAGALCFGTAALSVAAQHDKSRSQEGHGHDEAGMPPMGPPPELKALEVMNGKYEVKFFYKIDPMSAEWTETEATAVLSTVAGGGAQQLVFEGEMMGMPLSRHCLQMWID